MTDWHLPLADDDPAPLWFQIAERLRRAVDSGAFKPGDTLPSEAQLNRQFGVSRATSRAALNKLEANGLIVRRSGKGSIVLRKQVDQPAEEMSGFSEDMRRRGLEPSYKVMDIGHEASTAQVAEALEVSSGTKVFRSYRLLLADGEPIGTAMSWLPPRLFRTLLPPTEDDLTTGSLYGWLRENCSVTVGRAREFIEAASATGDHARTLNVAEGSPLLIARRQSFDEADKPVEYVVLSFRSDRYRFHLEVRR
jgi:GntR family transcriptional regulator